jgi:hypothetical protein
VLNVDASKIIILQLNNCQLSILSIKTIKSYFGVSFEFLPFLPTLKMTFYAS